MAHYAITGTIWGAGGTTWAATSGGAATLGDPTSADDVIFDGNSPNVSCSGSPVGKTLTCTGYTGTISQGGSAINISGNITLASGMTISGGSINMIASGTFTQNGATCNSDLGISGSGITVDIGGTVSLGSGSGILLIQGTLNANNYNITAGYFQTSGASAKTLNLGSGTWTLTAAASWIVSAGTTLNASTSTIKFTNTSNTAIQFQGGGKTYYNLWFDRGASTGGITITGANTFHDLKDTGTAAHTITFPNSTTTAATITDFTGSAGNLITLQRTGGSGTWTLSVASGVVSLDYMSISNGTATGGATFYAGSHSTDGGGNTGWNFSDPSTTYNDSVSEAGSASESASATQSVQSSITEAGSASDSQSVQVIKAASISESTTPSKDSFSDTNGTLLTNHTPDIGPAWSVMTTPSEWTIQSNKLSRTANTIDHAFINLGLTDMFVQATFSSLQNLCAILARRSSISNQWELYYDIANNGWQLNKVVSGVDIPVGPLLPGSTGTVSLRCIGNLIIATGPGGDTYSTTDSTHNTNTGAGLILDGFAGVPSIVDDWTTESVSDIPSATAVLSGSATESTSASDSQSNLLITLSDITEPVTASDDQDSAETDIANISELADALDITDASGVYTSDITESITAIDDQDAVALNETGLNEPASASEDQSASSIVSANNVETATAQDNTDATFFLSDSVSESATASEATAATVVSIAAAAEDITAIEAVGATRVTIASGNESANASDNNAGGADYNVSISESGSAIADQNGYGVKPFYNFTCDDTRTVYDKQSTCETTVYISENNCPKTIYQKQTPCP